MYSFISIHASDTHHPTPSRHPPPTPPAFPDSECVGDVTQQQQVLQIGGVWIQLEYYVRRNRLCRFQKRFLPAQKCHGSKVSTHRDILHTARNFARSIVVAEVLTMDRTAIDTNLCYHKNRVQRSVLQICKFSQSSFHEFQILKFYSNRIIKKLPQ